MLTKYRLFALLALFMAYGLIGFFGPSASADQAPTNQEPIWAFEETFDGDPASPSQDLLPRTLDYVVTHRTRPGEQFTKVYDPFPADHNESCAGPNPAVSPLPRHMVQTRQDSSGTNPDESFFICKNHMMTALGQVDPYSVSAFWPRQEFDFSDGGVLEFEVNMNLSHTDPEQSKTWVRSWWEVMIVPRDQLKVAAAPPFPEAAVDETYPAEHIVLDFRMMTRRIRVGKDELAPNGWIQVPDHGRDMAQYHENWWHHAFPDDPALSDPRVRRTMRMQFEQNRITWSIETADGSFDDFYVDVPDGLPFTKGLVLFKTHGYTPEKEGNMDHYTFHWDNIRFDGPVVGQYESYEADDVVYLENNGNRPIGDTQTVNVDLPQVGPNPVLFGQVNKPISGQVLVSINGGPDTVVHPYSYNDPGCMSDFWKSFRLPLDPSSLRQGNNTITWKVGPSNSCANGEVDWDGFSVKSLEIQMDAGAANPQPTATSIPPTATPEPTETSEPVAETETGVVSVQLFIDANGNGSLDAGEQPLAGLDVNVADDQDGFTSLSSATDENGIFRFATGGTESYTITIPIPPSVASENMAGVRLNTLETERGALEFRVINNDGTTTIPDAIGPLMRLPLMFQ